MEPGASIVVGTDGSRAASETVQHGAAVARALGATLHIVSAYPHVTAVQRRRELAQLPVNLRVDGIDDPQNAARAILEDAAHEIRHRGLTVLLHAVPGDPARALCDVAERVGARLILVGNRGTRSPLRYVRPPISRRIERHAPCPVRVVATQPHWLPAARSA